LKIEPLVELWKRRDDNLDRRIIDWAGANLAADKANDLIAIIRNSLSAIDVENELKSLVASLAQPTAA
jgi:hypothetical protein